MRCQLICRFAFIYLIVFFIFLNYSRHLEEREVLKAKLESMERKLEERDNDIRQLNRRNYLETKNFKTQLATERKKYKELCQKQNNNIDKTGEKISSNDSDYSSAKDIKEVKCCKRKYNSHDLFENFSSPSSFQHDSDFE